MDSDVLHTAPVAKKNDNNRKTSSDLALRDRFDSVFPEWSEIPVAAWQRSHSNICHRNYPPSPCSRSLLPRPGLVEHHSAWINSGRICFHQTPTRSHRLSAGNSGDSIPATTHSLSFDSVPCVHFYGYWTTRSTWRDAHLLSSDKATQSHNRNLPVVVGTRMRFGSL